MILSLLHHCLQVRLYEVIDTQTRLYLVLEFADGGDMYDYIMRHEGGLGEDAARQETVVSQSLVLRFPGF